MPAFPIFVRSLGGRCKEYEVTDETEIESLEQQHRNEETVPEFYEVHLYHDIIELGEGTVRDACLTQGSELRAIVSGPTQKKHMQTITQLRAVVECTAVVRHQQLFHSTQAVVRCAAAVRLLGDYFDEWDRDTIDALRAMLCDTQIPFADACDAMTLALGEVFGRICDPAIDYIPDLISYLPNDASILALEQIDARGAFPLELKNALMQQWCQRRPHYGEKRSFPWYPTYESMLAQTRLVASVPDARLRQLYTHHLDFHRRCCICKVSKCMLNSFNWLYDNWQDM